ncbi:hypothetical protein [Vitiosangium sp. GDMCC 1.1324]|uniref:hypothetical protein n=1 Tax=Vitiosangium sp. (strain GDMCC 1.1324) TaxID=2138576 RepID=UPI000D3725C4|nr:hypothetical protein [Vitiosangium sp. GDMCC 1.1324]PTL77396.1 hypothetical protein DAT35_44085 [Vitiosangium sp. GDMCC 1.1324]
MRLNDAERDAVTSLPPEKKRVRRWVFVLGGLMMAWGCGGGGEPVEERPTFSRDVVPLLQGSCGFGSGCHGTAQPAGYVQLITGSGDAAALLERLKAKSVREPSLPLVDPGNPSGSFLLRKVTGDFSGLSCGPNACGERMPQRSTPLPQEDIDLLERWIQQGAVLE